MPDPSAAVAAPAGSGPERGDPAHRASLDYPAIPVDGLLRDAARRWPDRIAIQDGATRLSFADLDATADRVAAAITRRVGGPGRRCAITTVLSPLFAGAFYGIARSGNVAVSVNPLHRPAAMVGTIAASGAALVLADPATLARLSPLADRLPPLVPLAELTAPAADPVGGQATPPPPVGPDDVACLHYTSGTTGEPKGVLLTHRNLVVNALQTVQAHHLDTASVTFNGLPAYHLMHLNAAVCAGATQHLYGAPALRGAAGVTESVREAERVGATHYYTLPVLLAMLAADEGLDRLRVTSVRGMYCGGSALPAPVARRLSDHFGIPVVQGFGLAEASSMTHLDRPDRPRFGSVGVPAADTGCRVVDVTTRVPLGAGEVGEIQVRGPQLMAGYVDGASAVDADGWFSTGDVGRIDPEGYLYLVDRLKDVFKRDNELVSPSELEQVLGTHPAVRDCAVVDRPDPLHGAVPVALLVLDGSAGPDHDEVAATVLAYANGRLAPFQRIVAARVVDAVPRTPVGKIARRVLRETYDEPETTEQSRRDAPCSP
ncbi:class I adenylate-forming enzyme family protein [Micromonospora sp. NPDC050980]|uniref:class I adenylate-forming enzyme family protein n=1 Tax=Micromonospora sp. NPDC050980 TaxID=3155161 RepID=UPI0033E1E2F8